VLSRFLSVAVVSACCCAAPKEPPRSPAQVVVPAAVDEPEQRASASEPERCVRHPRPARPLRPVAEVPTSPDDPAGGTFTLDQALAGLPGDFPLEMVIETSEGTLSCELWEHVAPRTVASIVGLARGIRPFKDPNTGQWGTRPAYDGTSFHRIIRGFMIQGGDPTGYGRGEPGFVTPDEIDESVPSDRRGLLYMANRGPNTNGMQFFILDAAAEHIGGRYTAFGECAPSETIERIASVETGAGDRPKRPVTISRVSVTLEGSCARP